MWTAKFLVLRWLTFYLLFLEFQILSTNYQPLEVSSHSKPVINSWVIFFKQHSLGKHIWFILFKYNCTCKMRVVEAIFLSEIMNQLFHQHKFWVKLIAQVAHLITRWHSDLVCVCVCGGVSLLKTFYLKDPLTPPKGIIIVIAFL